MVHSSTFSVSLLACAVALSACDHPKELHDFTYADTLGIQMAAQPDVALGPSEKLYAALALADQRAFGGPNDRAMVEAKKISVENAQKIAVLLSAWCAEHGGLGNARRYDEASIAAQSEMYRMVAASIDALPTDPYLAQGALCFALRLRQEGTGLMAAMLSIAVVNKVRSNHPHPPAAWQTYALHDDELQHAFASEAANISERLRGVHGEVLARHQAWTSASQLSKAPATLAAMDAFASTTDALFRRESVGTEITSYVRKWKTAAADYTAWIAGK
ncbi:MAG TPA: hypothetical protein PLF40_03175 [Kofleriaceae bacterium]|nr:hypothetical protein [Kofleriaceae bacterium]